MSTETSWIRRIEEAVEESKIIPLWGVPPTFPWEEFTEKLSSALELPKLRPVIEKTEWKKGEALFAGLGKEPQIIALEIPPLSRAIFLAISEEERAKLINRTVSAGKEEKGFSHPDFQTGFLLFLLLEVANILDEIKALGDLSVRVGKPAALPEGEALCHEIALQIGREKVRCRLIFPMGFEQELRAHFSQRKPSLEEYALGKETVVSLRVEIGSTSLKQQMWQQLKNGDLLVLDRCSFDPLAHKGSAMLLLDKTALFQGRIKENSLKIVDYAFYKEENMSPSEEDFAKEESLEEAPVEESAPPSGEMLPLSEIPLQITVEAGRIEMSIEKLLQMKPGNLLELGIAPEEGVYLTTSGRRIARGELVKIGELLGVRILETKT